MEETNYTTSFWQQKNTSWKGFIHLNRMDERKDVFHTNISPSYVWWNPFTWYNTEVENTSKN
jgi:hypothetical protein